MDRCDKKISLRGAEKSPSVEAVARIWPVETNILSTLLCVCVSDL
jgi:hypothetical protein